MRVGYVIGNILYRQMSCAGFPQSWNRQYFIPSNVMRRVPTVMENPGKSWGKKLSWKVMEKSWKLKKINKVMETEKS